MPDTNSNNPAVAPSTPTANNNPIINIDALIPKEMAIKAEDIGVKKARMGWRIRFVLAIMAGAFIALGSVFATTITAGAADKLPYGVIRLLSGLAFCLGLILGCCCIYGLLR